MWLLLAFVSATLLGLYDVVKKISLERNAVIPVLFLNIFFCCLLFLPVVLLSALAPDMMRCYSYRLSEVKGIFCYF